jgi:SAM-dependent methyltransferase
MPWWFHVAESKHEIQNPTSRDKILLLGERVGLKADSHVLDMGSGRGGPAVLLAQSHGCHVTCVEQSDEFVAVARERAHAAEVDALVEVIHSDGEKFTIETDRYDCALCLGATFIWGGLPETVAALGPGVRAGGFVGVGEPYWLTWPLPPEFDPDGADYLPLAETVTRFEDAGLALVTLIASSPDDWDRYESLQWLAVEEWVHDHPSDPDAERFREMSREYRDRYLNWLREMLGWGIFVGRKRRPPVGGGAP